MPTHEKHVIRKNKCQIRDQRLKIAHIGMLFFEKSEGWQKAKEPYSVCGTVAE